jgi:3-oxosteroid 1-dehydrogenase
VIERSQGIPELWDDEVDFVVLGTGASGLTGAVAAAAQGASVRVLEKTEFVGGTSAISGGGFWIPLNHHTPEAGFVDDRDDVLAYLRASAGGTADDDILLALTDEGHVMIRFLEERCGATFRAWPGKGATIDYRPELPGARHGGRTLDAGNVALAELGEWGSKLRRSFLTDADATTDRLPYKGENHHALPRDPSRFPPLGEGAGQHVVAGAALMAQLLRACLDKGVAISLETPARQLLVDGGAVVGVLAEADGAPLLVRARHGVLVATGGFAHNDELKRLWLDKPIDYSCEIEENQGDGHLMGMAVGAQLAGLGDAWWLFQGAGHINRYLPHTVVVNSQAKRFCNDAVNYYDFGHAFGTRRDSPEGRPRNLPAWMLFDSQGTRKYSALADHLTVAELEAKSPPAPNKAWAPTTLTTADSIEELAGKLGLDPVQLRETIDRFNGFARAGRDLDFGRGESRWEQAHGDPYNEWSPTLGTLEEPPFHALEIRSGALATRGGLRVNGKAEVLSALTGEAIPGLYAAGNASSGATPLSYPGAGSTIGAGMTFGWIAAQQVVAKLGQPVAARAD